MVDFGRWWVGGWKMWERKMGWNGEAGRGRQGVVQSFPVLFFHLAPW